MTRKIMNTLVSVFLQNGMMKPLTYTDALLKETGPEGDAKAIKNGRAVQSLEAQVWERVGSDLSFRGFRWWGYGFRLIVQAVTTYGHQDSLVHYRPVGQNIAPVKVNCEP